MLLVAVLDLCRAVLLFLGGAPVGQIGAPLVLGLLLPVLAYHVHRRAVRLASLALAVLGVVVIGVLTVLQAEDRLFTVLNAVTLTALIAMAASLVNPSVGRRSRPSA
jgi:hypothetical protein